jgi:hypothetical protein
LIWLLAPCGTAIGLTLCILLGDTSAARRTELLNLLLKPIQAQFARERKIALAVAIWNDELLCKAEGDF